MVHFLEPEWEFVRMGALCGGLARLCRRAALSPTAIVRDRAYRRGIRDTLRRVSRLSGALALGGLLAGCVGETLAPSAAVAPVSKATSNLDFLYVTDRAPTGDSERALSYGSDRSRFMSFGSVQLADSNSPTAPSAEDKRAISDVVEIGRFPETPYDVEPTGNGYRRMPAIVAGHENAISSLQSEVRRRLNRTSRKEAVVFVHGYNASFKDAALAMGEICHDVGSDFVCVLLSWPAGGTGGILMGYNVDRESGEFAVADLKKAIRAIGETPGLRGLHLLAHSRGSDVLVTALHELGLEAYATRTSLSDKLKVRNIVLFAPDIDVDIASTKIFAAVSDPDLPYGPSKHPNGTFPEGSLHLTIYSSPNDKALGIASSLFGSEARLGQLDLARHAAQATGAAPNIAGLSDYIQVKGDTDAFGHGYFLSDPKVEADFVALIRDGAKPGDPGRSLDEISGPYWRLAGD